MKNCAPIRKRRRRRQREHQPLRADGLHPAADVADELRRPHRSEVAGAERTIIAAALCRRAALHARLANL
jgi:hypothetical protein